MESDERETQALLARLRTFCFPGGEDAARRVRGVKTSQRGDFRTSPAAKWMPFTAEETIDATRSSFCWEARFGGSRITSLAVTDAYEQGHGRLQIKYGGIVPLKKVVGPDVDKGELQRYLTALALCPSMMLNHPSLEWSTAGPLTLRLRDREGPDGATIDIELDEQGSRFVCRADRPRLVGRKSVLTPWSGLASEFKEWEGLRIASHLEVSWLIPELQEPFTYFKEEITSVTVLR